MPIFQTNTGYRDPLKAMTIKALEQRQKDAALAMAKAQQIEEPMTSPWQVGGHIAGILGQSLQQGRIDEAAASQREALSKLMGGVNAETGATSEQIAQMSAIDPEMGRDYYREAMDARQRAADRAFQTSERVAGQDFTAGRDDIKLQADILSREDEQQARADAAAKAAEVAAGVATTEHDREVAETKRVEEVESGKAKTDVGKINADYESGAFGAVGSPEAIATRDAAVKKATYTDPYAGMSPADQALDQQAAKDVADWQTSGGPNAVKSIDQLEHGIRLLETAQKDAKGNVIDPTGLAAGLAEEALPESLNRWLNPAGTEARDSIRTSVQESLKAVLGAQFAMTEGEQLLARAFSSGARPEENIRRAKMILEQVKRIAVARQAQADWLTKNHTMRNYTGPAWNKADLTSLDFNTGSTTEAPAAGAPAAGAPAGESIEDILKRNRGG